MYDRKTWIVIVFCTLLLGTNYYFMQKNQRAEMERRAQEARQVAALAPEKPALTSPGERGEVATAEPTPAATYELKTATTHYTFTSRGGALLRAELLDYARGGNLKGFVVLNDEDPSGIGTISEGVDGLEQIHYQLDEEESIPEKRLTFRGLHPSGLQVKKIWELVPDDTPGQGYQLDLRVEFTNPADAGAQTNLERFSLYLGRAQPLQAGESRINPATFFWNDKGDFKQKRSTSFLGGKFSKAKGHISKEAEQLDYAGVASGFFATALREIEPASGGVWAKATQITLPDAPDKAEYAVRAGLVLPSKVIVPGETVQLAYRLFAGPKDNGLLRSIGNGMGDVMAYGWPIVAVPARFMNFLLRHTHNVVSKFAGKWSWGLAVILVTLLVRGAMWPLYARSNRTMKRMSLLKPEMDKLKEKYPDDPAKMQQEMMGLYRKFGINPIGGCLPMFAQIPIFFGFFRMLQHAVEMRGSEFLWVSDLSMPDTVATVAGIPINILPIIMGVSSFLQMHFTPQATTDKTQAMVMKFMPLMFLFFCYNYGAALALYWTTSNLFSIVQVWGTRRLPDPTLKERKISPGKPGKPGKKSFMERMAEAAEEAQRKQKMRTAQGRVVEEEKKPRKNRGPRTGG